MTVYLRDPDVTLLLGDAIERRLSQQSLLALDGAS